ncbi:MAG: hypothetical protein K6E30_07390 [Lachnospiraceae bacterium]|nr:hypothetical protein [Lachnospiraceae bacterium]
MKENTRILETGIGRAEVLGAVCQKGGVNFAVNVPDGADASLVLVEKGSGEIIQKIGLPEEERMGDIASVYIPCGGSFEYGYYYEIEGKKELDPYAARIADGLCFVDSERFNWGEARKPQIPLEDLLIYKLHVRGFTMDPKSGVRDKGTFRGLLHKLPYIRDLGFNAVELMPAYEWDDTLRIPHLYEAKSAAPEHMPKNFWGYAAKNYYFSPKASFSAGRNSSSEFRELIKALHLAGMECIMEFYIPEKEEAVRVFLALRHWVRAYRVDGFHLIGPGVPSDIILKDPYLAGTKLFLEKVDVWGIYGSGRPLRRRFIEYNEWYEKSGRRFLKGDEWAVGDMINGIRRNPVTHGVVNYMANANGFTLADAVSYDVKHNEKNGEDNQDGPGENYSWNCGAEGATRKKDILKLRRKQIRNAFSYLLLSQGIPLIYAGDEFGNSQNGNNNGYALDNPEGWVSWGAAGRNSELSDFLRKLIAFRKAHPITHMPSELTGFDKKSLGFPDISFHSKAAFLPDSGRDTRAFGILLNGGYAELPDGKPDQFLYLMFNSGWKEDELALPPLPPQKAWALALTTDEEGCRDLCPADEDGFIRNEKMTIIPPRSVIVLIGNDKKVENEHPVSPENDNEAS